MPLLLSLAKWAGEQSTVEERTALTPEFGRIFDVDYRYK